MLSPLLDRRVSSFVALSIIIILSFITGAYTIFQASKLRAIENETLSRHSQLNATATIDY